MILIVDNDPFVAALLSIELQHQGISHAAIAVVETARRAITWLALHAQTPVDVVVLDRNRKVPGEDNLSLLVALRPALCPGAVIIVHSGWDEDDMVAQTRLAGVDAFITKNRSHPSPGKRIAETIALLRQATAEGRPRPWIRR